MKVCTLCNINKEDSDFYIHTETRGNSNGKKSLCSYCKECDKKRITERSREFKLNNPKIVSERRKGYKRDKVKVSIDNKKRQRNIKQKCVDLKGGKCVVCGYNKYLAALDFHHLDPSKKSFSVTGYTTTWEKIVVELNKCILLCSNCHRAVHSKELDLKNIETNECIVFI